MVTPDCDTDGHGFQAFDRDPDQAVGGHVHFEIIMDLFEPPGNQCRLTAHDGDEICAALFLAFYKAVEGFIIGAIPTGIGNRVLIHTLGEIITTRAAEIAFTGDIQRYGADRPRVSNFLVQRPQERVFQVLAEFGHGTTFERLWTQGLLKHNKEPEEWVCEVRAATIRDWTIAAFVQYAAQLI